MKISINQAVKILRKGGIIIYPTETAYALGADWTNKKAIKKIYKIKGRNAGKKLSVIVSNIKAANKYVRLDQTSKILIHKFMPGPLTLICPVRKGRDTLAFRISSNSFARKLTSKLGRPIVATSANISGKREIYSSKTLKKLFPNIPIIDAGELGERKPSTIYDVQRRKILRKGPVRENEIYKVLVDNQLIKK